MSLSDISACISARDCYAAGIAAMRARTDSSLCSSRVSGCMCVQVAHFTQKLHNSVAWEGACKSVSLTLLSEAAHYIHLI